MTQYKVVSRVTELPYGSRFTTVAIHPIEKGELALFSVGERFGENLIVGRWYPNVDGSDWILQRNRRIRVTKDVILWIVGLIVPLRVQHSCMN